MESYIFKSGKFNIYDLDRDVELQKHLIKYIKKEGFEYAAKNLMKIFVLKEPGYLDKVQFMLEDIDLFEKQRINIKTNLPKDKTIDYSKLQGLDKNFVVEYNSNGYFNILSVHHENRKFIKCTILQRNKIDIRIKIPRKKDYQFNDRIILRTNRDIKIININVRCIENKIKLNQNKELHKDIKQLKDKMNKDYFDLYNGLLCEKMLIKYKFLTEEISFGAKRMYKTGLYTNNTPKALRIINRASNIDSTNHNLIILESYGKNFDLNLVNRIIKFCENHKEERLDSVVNRLVNSNDAYFKEELVPIIYSFYKRNKDFNSLDVLVKKSIENDWDIKKYLSNTDINKLIEFYVKNNRENDRKLIAKTIDNS